MIKLEKKLGEITLFYRLIRSTDCMCESKHRNVYSLFISERRGNRCEQNIAFDITRDEKRATDLFYLLSENDVTPCTLTDVLEYIL